MTETASIDFFSLPSSFCINVLLQTHDIAQIKATLLIFYLLHSKKKMPAYITYQELVSQASSIADLDEETLKQALKLAVEHEAIFPATLNSRGKIQHIYANNTDRNEIEQILKGKAHFRQLNQERKKTTPNIFTLYEQNIGIITPMIAEELKESEKRYSPQWIEQAFKEAVVANKRSWRYIARILEIWASQGKKNGTHWQNTKKGNSDKYISGKYGHLVKR